MHATCKAKCQLALTQQLGEVLPGHRCVHSRHSAATSLNSTSGHFITNKQFNVVTLFKIRRVVTALKPELHPGLGLLGTVLHSACYHPDSRAETES